MEPTFFKSFTGLSVKQFDDIYKVIYQISYPKHEIKGLSHNKRNREKELCGAGAGRGRFKLDVKDRVTIIMVLVYYLLCTPPIS
jgi:hypothetical protein